MEKVPLRMIFFVLLPSHVRFHQGPFPFRIFRKNFCRNFFGKINLREFRYSWKRVLEIYPFLLDLPHTFSRYRRDENEVRLKRVFCFIWCWQAEERQKM